MLRALLGPPATGRESKGTGVKSILLLDFSCVEFILHRKLLIYHFSFVFLEAELIKKNLPAHFNILDILNWCKQTFPIHKCVPIPWK